MSCIGILRILKKAMLHYLLERSPALSGDAWGGYMDAEGRYRPADQSSSASAGGGRGCGHSGGAGYCGE